MIEIIDKQQPAIDLPTYYTAKPAIHATSLGFARLSLDVVSKAYDARGCPICA
ncbi:hypothetical protein QCO44_11095 [Selenomonas sputigena]|uniref:Uncharacterized protein n=1 Tax=Selenomonas sputigena TaxID=69823 RepID=A0ABV3X7I1_9FIRM